MPTGKPNSGTGKVGGTGHRKSTAALMMSGTLQHDPKRYAARLQEPGAGLRTIGDPPAYLKENEVECWFEILSICHKGTVFEQDRFAVAEFAKVLAAMRGEKSVSPSVHQRFFKFISLFGLSPADRSRVSAKPSDESDSNPFANLT